MSDNEVDIRDILKRIDDLIRVLKIISDDLTEISRMLRAYATSREEIPITQESSLSQIQKLRVIDDIQRFFPQDLLGLLIFEVTGEHIIVKPRQYLGPENFAKIASIVREQLKGEYVSHGKESHFRVPRKV